MLLKLKNKRNLQLFLLFTVIFTIFWTSTYAIVFFHGKTLIYNDDCYVDYYEGLAFKSDVVKEFVHNVKIKHEFSIPLINYNMTGDSNLSHNIFIEPFDMLFWFTPRKSWEFLFQAVMFLRMLITGWLFVLFCREKGCEYYSSILGSLTVVFSNWAVLATTKQPAFIYMMMLMAAELLGIEYIRKYNSSRLFRITVFLNTIATLYYIWYNTLILVTYCIVLFVYEKNQLKVKIKNYFAIAGNYAVGFLVGGIIFVPLALEVTETSRMGEKVYDGSNLTFGLVHYIKSIAGMFSWGDDSISASWIYYGFIPLAFFALICLFSIKMDNIILKFLVIFSYISTTIPIVSRLFGITTVNGRWTYILTFIAGFVVAKYTPVLLGKDNTRIPKKIVYIGSGLYIVLLTGLYFEYRQEIQIVMSIISVALMTTALSLCWRQHQHYNRNIAIITAVSCVIVVINSFDLFDDSFLNNEIDIGGVVTKADGYMDAAYKEIIDDSFYRIEKTYCVDEHSCCLPYWFGYNGISSKQNIINPAVLEYYNLTGNTGLMQTNKASDFDSRMSAELLANVKYFISDEFGKKIPYGFQFLKKNQTGYYIYENSNNVGLSFAYSDEIGMEQFSQLDPARQDEVMLKYIVLDDPNTGKIDTNDFHSKEIKYSINESSIGTGNLEWTIPSTGGVLCIEFNLSGNGEVYIQFPSINNITHKNMRVTLATNTITESITCPSIYTDYTSKQSYFVVNLGNLSNEVEGKISLVISFSQVDDDVTMLPIRLYQRITDVDSDVDRLKNTGMKNIVFSTNEIKGEINAKTEEWLCFSIPYEKGWHCFVDGVETPIQKANVMLMAIKINEGSHVVQLKYFPYGMNLGIWMTVVGLLLSATIEIIHKRSYLFNG